MASNLPHPTAENMQDGSSFLFSSEHCPKEMLMLRQAGLANYDSERESTTEF